MIGPQGAATDCITANIGHIGITVDRKTTVAGKVRGKDRGAVQRGT